MNVIPVINCTDVESVKKEIEVMRTFLPEAALVHLDVTDGSFAKGKTWSDSIAWPTLRSPFGLEVHLMVDHPEEILDNWLAAGARRIIVHMESLNKQSLHEILSASERYHVEMMLSSKPESTFEDVLPYAKYFTSFQVLGVNPGASGQIFLGFVNEKIRFLREEAPDAIIEVDGGMNPETAKRVRDEGADTIVSSSYIFKSNDPKKAYNELKNI